MQFTSPEQPEPLTINPGDLIMADEDGVVAVPPAKVDDCVEICEERFRIDELTMEALRKGEPIGPTIQKLRK